MAQGMRNEWTQKRRRSSTTPWKWLAVIVVLALVGVYAYKSGARFTETELVSELAELEDLRQQIATLSEQVTTLNQENDGLRNTLTTEQRQASAEAQQRIRELEQVLEIQTGQMQTLEQRLRESESASEARLAETKLATALAELEVLSQQNTTLSQQNTTLGQQNTTLSQENTTLSQQNKTLNQENDVLRNALSAAQHQGSAEAQQRVRELEQAMEIQNGQLRTLEQRLRESPSTSDSRLTEIEFSNELAELEALRQQNAALSQENDVLRTSLTTAQDQASAGAEQRVQQLEQALEIQSEQLRTLEQRLRESQSSSGDERWSKLIQDKLGSGVEPDKILAAVNRLRPPDREPVRVCDRAPRTKRFQVQVPTNPGKGQNAINFENGALRVTAMADSAVDASGRPDIFFDPARPVTVVFEHREGFKDEVVGTLPITHELVIGEIPESFVIEENVRGFVQVTGGRCRFRYP